MRRVLTALVVSLGVAGSSWAATYVVTNTLTSGAGSLREAIKSANANAGADLITFAAGLSGQTIALTAALPSITGEYLTLDGDLNNDGKPDIALSGQGVASGHGLAVLKPHCTIVGLAFINWPWTGMTLQDAHHSTIRSCYFGEALAQGVKGPNGIGMAEGAQLTLWNSDHVTVGGTDAKQRNVFYGGQPADHNVGLLLVGSQTNTIVGNFFGLTQNGGGAWADQNIGVYVRRLPGGRACTGNLIGGEVSTGEANYFASLHNGVWLENAPLNRVRGNYFGLLSNRSTASPMLTAGVTIGENSHSTIVGGSPSERNVFVSDHYGVRILGPNAGGTWVFSNYFGTNGAGTAERKMRVCVALVQPGGPQYIGDGSTGGQNYFLPNSAAGGTVGVEVWHAGSGMQIEGNVFGRLPNGADGSRATRGVYCVGASPLILNNWIARAEHGVDVYDATSYPQAYLNRFDDCLTAVRVNTGARCRLGNLGVHTGPEDDGGNVFTNITDWFIYNDSADGIKAEGNLFDTSSTELIDLQIYDKLDNTRRGRVDYLPLGEEPGASVAAAATVHGATAVPLPAGGAEIAFTLSSPAEVTVSVLNIAGRLAATVVQDRATPGGLQRLAWNGQSAAGTRAPDGRYLVRVEARSATGGTSRAVASLLLAR